MTDNIAVLLTLTDQNSSASRTLSLYNEDGNCFYLLRDGSSNKMLESGVGPDLQRAFAGLVSEYNKINARDDGHAWLLSSLTTKEHGGEVSEMLDASIWFAGAKELDAGCAWNPDSQVWYRHRVIQQDGFYAFQSVQYEGAYPEGVRVSSSALFSTTRYGAMNGCNGWLDEIRLAGWRQNGSFGLAAELVPHLRTAVLTGQVLTPVLL